MARKFIPDSDRGFAQMARVFADTIANNPCRYHLSASQAECITQMVSTFRATLVRTLRPSTRTKITIMDKDAARSRAERVIRQHANQIRPNLGIESIHKAAIGIYERPTRLRRRSCPLEPPYLRYVGSEDAGMHVLEFRERFGARSKAKPTGAARLELFVGLIAADEEVPTHPGEQPWYLRSFTTNPLRVEFPVSESPRMVVYWGRWADATGEVGRWSPTVVARVEGWGGWEGRRSEWSNTYDQSSSLSLCAPANQD